MQIDVVTIFPGMFPGALGCSILKRAQQAGRLRVTVHDLRDYTHDKRRTVDDRPYGGGPGMVMRVEPIFEAVEAILGAEATTQHRNGARTQQTILMSPQGQPLTSALARRLAGMDRLLILCGHYEGVDERVKRVVNLSVSIGDYVLTGGELPAMVLIDSVARFLPGVIGHAQATAEESFADGLLEYPHYTRPKVFREMAVPKVLLSGDHEAIGTWRKLQAMAKTLASRPDLVTASVRNEQQRGS